SIEDVSARLTSQKLLVLINKVDALSGPQRDEVNAHFPSAILLSAKEVKNMQQLEDQLVKLSEIDRATESNVLVSNIRHFEALKKAQTAIVRVNEGLDNDITGDFLSQDIRECLFHIGEITGSISTDEILGNIFGKFCIGK
ncbi:MAG: tRNA uridine-5-carboxymethylaminomethyl(34) synthesis GTPase MnmE, partial [Bacteroidales bacterium]|nr:tRNA uridine-5-carboxymethylaminomethyl(34) synthesis GTPase MnmE [Bacteroidales bacterium]